MTNCEAKAFIEEHIMWGEYNKGEYGKALKKAIKALEQQNDDCISRKEAIRIAEQGQVQGYPWQIAELSKLQSVQPEPKMGHWIEDAKTYYEELNKRGLGVDEYTPYFTDDIACSECLAKYSMLDNETQFFKHCPNCGCRMVEPQ